MQKETALPKYVQLSEMLIREIASGHLVDGARLPPERIMAADFGVAVGTLRKTLSDLEAKGLLERIQGSGNYIRANTITDSIYAFFRLELLRGGGLPTAEVLSVSKREKPKGAPDFGPSDTAHRIRRLRALGNQAAALEEIWLDAQYAPTLAPDELIESLYLYYREQLGLIIMRVEDKIGIDQIPDWSPPDFQLAPGDPCGYVERISWNQDGQLAEFSRTWFDARTVRYTNRF